MGGFLEPVPGIAVAFKAAMLRLTKQQRAMLVDKLPDAGNLAIGALVFGQFLSDGGFSSLVAFAGLALWGVLIGWAMFLSGGNQS